MTRYEWNWNNQMKEGQKCWDQYNDHLWIKQKIWKKIKAQDFTIECSSSKTKKISGMSWEHGMNNFKKSTS